MKTAQRLTALAIVVLTLNATWASAATITVVNPSFELDGNQSNFSNVQGWSSNSTVNFEVGVETPGSVGTYAAFLGTPGGSERYAQQVLAHAITGNTQYTLAVDAQRSADFATQFDLAFFYNDGLSDVIISRQTVTGLTTTYAPFQIDFTTPNSAAYLGENLGIRVIATEQWIRVDNVSVSSAVIAVPTPAALPAGLGLLALMGLRRRRSA
jgi:hypothetical protein